MICTIVGCNAVAVHPHGYTDELAYCHTHRHCAVCGWMHTDCTCPRPHSVSDMIAADISYLEDGSLYYFSRGGALSAHDLRLAADILDRLNAPIQADLERNLGPR